MNILKIMSKSDEEADSLGRHALLLASLVSLLVALPFFRTVPGGGLRFSILLSLVLIAAVYVNSRNRWTFVAAVALGSAAIALNAVGEATGSVTAYIASTSLALGLLISTTLLMLSTLVRAERVSTDTIIGGICVYLMIGVGFAMAYILALILDPSALVAGDLPLGGDANDTSSRAANVLYFSFVTLTTLGFGDIRPSGELTRMLVTAEAIIGQLYVAIFIARLVALYIAGDRERLSNSASTRIE